MQKVKVIGAGLAGCEAAYFLARRGVSVQLYDAKPHKMSAAHTSGGYAELVCSNSLKSDDVYGNACGLLKEEMRQIGSLIIDAADSQRVPAGGALAVDREKFSRAVTDKIKSHKNIECIESEVREPDLDGAVIVATGPLTLGGLLENIPKLSDRLHFYDAAAPVVAFDSIDMNCAFFGDRYDRGNGDHINCPLTEDEYKLFVKELVAAERVTLKEFENAELFEGCMPVEELARRGERTLKYGPLKPTGLDDPKTGRWPYACLQLRKENLAGTMYNMIGFQTNLKFFEQKRVFSIIKALKNAEFLRYGVMHKNTYIDSPKLLNADYSLKEHPLVFFAGQISGVEGYVESAASGLTAAVSMYSKLKGGGELIPPSDTVSGALCRYVAAENKNFQPMNANFGLLRPLDEGVRDKKLKKQKMAERALFAVNQYIKSIESV